MAEPSHPRLPAGADVTLHRVGPDDWRAHRDLRLEMLLDAPDAFWTQHADVADLDEAAWRSRIAAQHHLHARAGGDGDNDNDPVGSVGLFQDPDEAPGTLTLVAMYVAPRARGRGVGERLVQAVLDEAVARGCRRVVLEVTSGDEPALGLYERMGFRLSGRSAPHPRRAHLLELTMERDLTGGSRPPETRIPPGAPDVEG